MTTPINNREAAIHQLTRGHDLVTQLRSLLQLPAWADDRSELAGELSQEILHALTVALSILTPNKPRANPTESPAETGSGLTACSSPRQSEGSVKKVKLPAAPRDQNPRGQKRPRKHSSSRTIVTAAPYADGHQWRKYGQKTIHNAKHPRSYYRCTHRDDKGCLATKQVQQQDCQSDSPMFQVTYHEQHTCNKTIDLPIPQFMAASPAASWDQPASFFIFDSQKQPNHGFVKNEIRQELHPLSPITQLKQLDSTNGLSSDPAATGLTLEEFMMNVPDIDDIMSSGCSFRSPHGSEFEDVVSVLSLLV